MDVGKHHLGALSFIVNNRLLKKYKTKIKLNYVKLYDQLFYAC